MRIQSNLPLQGVVGFWCCPKERRITFRQSWHEELLQLFFQFTCYGCQIVHWNIQHDIHGDDSYSARSSWPSTDFPSAMSRQDSLDGESYHLKWDLLPTLLVLPWLWRMNWNLEDKGRDQYRNFVFSLSVNRLDGYRQIQDFQQTLLWWKTRAIKSKI